MIFTLNNNFLNKGKPMKFKKLATLGLCSTLLFTSWLVVKHKRKAKLLRKTQSVNHNQIRFPGKLLIAI